MCFNQYKCILNLSLFLVFFIDGYLKVFIRCFDCIIIIIVLILSFLAKQESFNHIHCQLIVIMTQNANNVYLFVFVSTLLLISIQRNFTISFPFTFKGFIWLVCARSFFLSLLCPYSNFSSHSNQTNI